MDNRLTGKFEYWQDNNPARHILIEAKETPSAYTFKLLENTTRLDYDHFILLFKGRDTVRIAKDKSPHSIILWGDGDFTIYPRSAGIPFWFRRLADGNRLSIRT